MVPRVSDTAEPFRSRILGAWQRRSQILDEVLPLLYLEGLSTRDFRRALQPLWGKSGLSKSTISRANHTLKDAFRVWRERDLSSEDIAYLFLDGFYLGVRQGTGGKEAVLVAMASTREAKACYMTWRIGDSNLRSSSSPMATPGFCGLFVMSGQKCRGSAGCNIGNTGGRTLEMATG